MTAVAVVAYLLVGFALSVALVRAWGYPDGGTWALFVIVVVWPIVPLMVLFDLLDDSIHRFYQWVDKAGRQ